MRYALLALLCAVFPLGHVLAQTEDQRKATVAYLRSCQQPDGGFVPAKADRTRNGAPRSSLRASTAALRALRYFGGEAPDRVACARFVQRCFDKNGGGFANYPGQPSSVAATYYAGTILHWLAKVSST
jgi:prenyltransferase beta subunit